MKSILKKFTCTNKTVVITGGAGLLGRMHAEAVAQAGGIPVLGDINEASAKKSAAVITKKYGVKAFGIKLDVTVKDDIQHALNNILKKYRQIDVLINNAANDPKVKKTKMGFESSRFESFSLDQWEQDLQVGLTGAFLCSQIFGAEMAKKKRGVILNISSDLGIIAPDQRIYRKKNCPDALQPVKPVSYSVVKHALIGLTKYLATYWADKGVRVNAICPGGVYHHQPEEFVKKLTNLIPLGRMARKDEYQAAILFLISEASSYMTGSTIVMDGGRHCW